MWKVSHMDSFRSRNTRELGNGLLELKRRCSWLDNIRLNPMSRLTWPVKIKHKTRSLNCFFLAVPLLEMHENSLPRDEINSVKKWDKFSLFQFSRSGPHFSPRTTWPETNDNGEILRHRNKANFYPSFTKRSTKKYLFITAVEYLRCDIFIDLCGGPL